MTSRIGEPQSLSGAVQEEDHSACSAERESSAAPAHTLAAASHPALQYGKKHLATCGSLGWTGRRVGTRFAHNPRQVRAIYNEPWFRFRNDDCERLCREAWRAVEPTEGTHFVVADVPPPETGWCTRIDDLELRRCPLAKYEADGYRNARLHQIGDTDFYQCLASDNGFGWDRVGRVLRLKSPLSGAQRSEISPPPAPGASSQQAKDPS